ncbi:hypothetical protein N0V84_005013 [Fusarium piperis]|uniref:Uncharacterized protein n=1 Tax=Fusarium piperis TaxID=1435070 RepID=A0A9W9BPD1_9HYPO|nr:hypothetical protein N0V84_005013 [Fusarium piperis]
MAVPGSGGTKSAVSSCTTSELSSGGSPTAAQVSASSTALNGPSPTSTGSGISTAAGLSLSQQLMLADAAADRFDLLPDDAQFVFDFNKALDEAGGDGDGGDLAVANRKTFPALIGTGGGMAVGRVGRKEMSVPF